METELGVLPWVWPWTDMHVRAMPRGAPGWGVDGRVGTDGRVGESGAGGESHGRIVLDREGREGMLGPPADGVGCHSLDRLHTTIN